jgi:hypothetical protein
MNRTPCLDHPGMDELDFYNLTRRPGDGSECWHIYWRDIKAGTISRATGMPNAKNCFTWSAGFYLGCHPRQIISGTADTFDEAREKFLPAWLKFARSRKPEDFEAWRDQQRWTAEKYAARDAGLPTTKR